MFTRWVLSFREVTGSRGSLCHQEEARLNAVSVSTWLVLAIIESVQLHIFNMLKRKRDGDVLHEIEAVKHAHAYDDLHEDKPLLKRQKSQSDSSRVIPRLMKFADKAFRCSYCQGIFKFAALLVHEQTCQNTMREPADLLHAHRG